MAALLLFATSCASAARKLPPSPLAEFVRQSAREAFASVPKPAESRAKFEAEFLDSFLDGFRSGDGSAGGEGVYGSWFGFEAGKAYRRNHPDQIDTVLKAYGYRAVQRVGVYSSGFEVSTFFPDEGGVWWLETITAKWPEPMPEPPPYRIAQMRFRVAGYLSPPGRYGHRGSCSHRLLATKIEIVAAPAPPSVTPLAGASVAPDDSAHPYRTAIASRGAGE